MKQLSSCTRGLALVCLLQSLFLFRAGAQTLTMIPNVNIESNCNGYDEYLPQGYNSSKLYPLILAFHGAGEDGDGTSSSTGLGKLVNTGLPALINSGRFPTSFNLNGTNYQFIIVFPQFKTDPPDAPGEIDIIYTYMLTHYPVDVNRVYMTGYSQGGGNIWKFTGANSDVSKIAAIVPIAGSITLPASYAQNIASANLPVLATHNNGDNVIPYTYTVDNINLINSSTPPPTPRALDTIFNASGHDSWDHTYDPAQFTYNGLSIYQWMLQYQRGLGSALPVTLGAYTAQQTGPAAITVNWTTLTEINNRYFTLERSADGKSFTLLDTIAATNSANGHAYSFIDQHPLSGKNYYRLSQTDIDGKQTYFSVLEVTMAPAAAAALRISPNPAGSFIQLELTHPETGDLHVILSDMQGRALRTWTFNKQSALWQQSLQLGKLPAGNYTIQIRGTSIREVQQFVKQ